jgi:hypothetical protein
MINFYRSNLLHSIVPSVYPQPSQFRNTPFKQVYANVYAPYKNFYAKNRITIEL